MAVLDTGLNIQHVDFSGPGRIPARRNFTDDDAGNLDKVTDGTGHGTNVGGIIVAISNIPGSPGADIIPLKVLDNSGGGGFDAVENALKWVLQNHEKYKISTVLLALGDTGNYENDDKLARHLEVLKRWIFSDLRRAGVATVAPAGNGWYRYNEGKGRGPEQGMQFPAICGDTISVGATFLRAQNHPVSFADGALRSTNSTGSDPPFSQRLHEA